MKRVHPAARRHERAHDGEVRPQRHGRQGELGKVDGSPVVVSEYVRQDLNATGVQDGVTTNRTVAISVRTDGHVVGNRRGLKGEVLRELYAESDQDAIILSTRKALTSRYPAETVVAVTYNGSTA
jgi:hypothetical protein